MQEFEKVETREAMFNPPSTRSAPDESKKKKGNSRKPMNIREFAAAIAGGYKGYESGEDDGGPEVGEQSNHSNGTAGTLEEKLDNLTSVVAALATAQAAGGKKPSTNGKKQS